MSTSSHHEPTNDELWAQPPADGPQALPGQGVAPYQPAQPAPVRDPQWEAPPDRTPFVLAIVSLGVGVPLSGIGGGISGLPGLLIVWVGIVLVNLVYGWMHRKH